MDDGRLDPRRITWRRRTGVGVVGALVIGAVLAAPTAATYPDRNGRLLFQADTGSGYQLYTIKANGHDLRQVTHVTDSDAVLGDWSPDGTRIVYDHNGETFGRVEIMNADGTDVRILAGTGVDAGVTYAGDPSFTPDGGHVVFNKFVEATQDFGIWIMNVDGSGQHEIGDLPYADPNVAPDGATLLMLGQKDDDGRQQALFTASITGGDVHQLTSFALDAAGKSDWAPDGRRVITSENANIPEASANLVTIPRQGGEPFHVTNYTDPDVRAYVGGYSPDGNWIVFRLEDHGKFALCLVRPDGTGLRTILPLSDFKPRGIDWGPAGQPPSR
jgi:Tol biopolymer transport system component